MADEWSHGSSKFAGETEIEKAGYFADGIKFGYIRSRDKADAYRAITYAGDGHMLTIAPTRSGKGTCQIIPEIMSHAGALLCIDPKGENAIITAQVREQQHGQTVHLLDPWGIAAKQLDRPKARFNPLDMLSADSPDLVDDAMMIADALIVADGGDSHWSNEARAMVMGIILHLVTSPKEAERRTLGRMRDILNLHPKDFMRLVAEDMGKEGHPFAQSAANRMMQKSERELSSVISTAQQNTHFLESDNIKESLSASDFDFADLKSNEDPLSVFLILPADRLNTHGRWLRLIVSMAVTAMVRGGRKPRRSALFLLDEFAALGKLSVVEQAFGLMAGFGMQIHAILQDLSQLQDLYNRRWQTFMGNAAVVQIFGTRDLLTAEYASKLAGQTTVEKVSQATTDVREKGEGLFGAPNPNFRHMNDSSFGRALIMPEELMRLSQSTQLLIFPTINPVIAGKMAYYADSAYYDDNVRPIFNPHPDYSAYENPKAWTLDEQERRQRLEDERNPKPEKKRGWLR